MSTTTTNPKTSLSVVETDLEIDRDPPSDASLFSPKIEEDEEEVKAELSKAEQEIDSDFDQTSLEDEVIDHSILEIKRQRKKALEELRKANDVTPIALASLFSRPLFLDSFTFSLPARFLREVNANTILRPLITLLHSLLAHTPKNHDPVHVVVDKSEKKVRPKNSTF